MGRKVTIQDIADALDVLREMGKSVPEDVFLCGFDDSPESGRLMPLSTRESSRTVRVWIWRPGILRIWSPIWVPKAVIPARWVCHLAGDGD